jgi:hypothetical protein
MKRATLLLVAVVGVIGIVLYRSLGSTGAEITIEAERPADLRQAVVATVASFNGVRVTESTDFGGGGNSELSFTVPTGNLDQVVNALGNIGGRVVSQRIDRSDDVRTAASITSQVRELESCLSHAGSNPASLATCRNQAQAASTALTGAPKLAETSELAVHLRQPAGLNLWVAGGIVVVLGAVVAAAVTLLRGRDRRGRTGDFDLFGDSDVLV